MPIPYLEVLVQKFSEPESLFQLEVLIRKMLREFIGIQEIQIDWNVEKREEVAFPIQFNSEILGHIYLRNPDTYSKEEHRSISCIAGMAGFTYKLLCLNEQKDCHSEHIFNHLPIVITLRDKTGKQTFQNKFCTKLLGNNFTGTSYFDVYPTETAIHLKAYDDYIWESRNHEVIEEVFTLKDKRFIFLTGKLPIVYQDQHLLLTYSFDITKSYEDLKNFSPDTLEQDSILTEHKVELFSNDVRPTPLEASRVKSSGYYNKNNFQQSTERIHLTKESRYQQLVENANEFIFRCDFKGKFLFVNSTGLKKTGYTLNEMQQMYFHEVINPRYREEAIQLYKAQFEKKIRNTYHETSILTKEGEQIWIGQNVHMLMANNHVLGFEAVARDITRQKRVEQELIEAQRKLEQIIREKELFISIMSHEIRTPINSVVGTANLLLKRSFYPEQFEYLSALKISGENLIAIVNNILDLAKIESGNITITNVPFALEESIERIRQTFIYKAAEKNLNFNISVEPDLPPKLYGDQVKLNQILLNLVSNAVKFTEKGEVRLEVRKVGETQNHTSLHFEITDTGIGIAENKRKEIFESFKQATPEISTQFGGTGLGLTITKKLVEILGGSIEVKSKEQNGSSFYFTLIFQKIADQAYSGNQKITSLAGTKILLAEDNELNTLVTKKILENEGIIVEVAQNGQEVLRKMNASFDLILMDIHMPIINGYETCEHLRQTKFNQIPVIALTANTSLNEQFQNYFNDVLTKPFKPTDLFQKIEQLLMKKKPTESKDLHSGENEVINLSYLQEASGGNNAFIGEMIRIFLKQTPIYVEELKILGSEQNWSEFRKIMHKLKPTLFMMGIAGIEALVKEIEKCSKEQKSLDLLPEYLNTLESLASASYNELEKALKNF